MTRRQRHQSRHCEVRDQNRLLCRTSRPVESPSDPVYPDDESHHEPDRPIDGTVKRIATVESE